MSQIICTDAALGYDGITVTENISFSLDKGSYLCIVGENGSGKSTLIKALLGLVKPLRGHIEINGGQSEVSVGYLPQQTEIQKDFPASVSEVVLSGCNPAGHHVFLRKSDKKRARYNMERLGISDISKKSVKELSGGQLQRVLLARALCAASDILLLDEPAAGLDPVVTNDMYDILSKLNHNDKMTVIMVSHDVSAAMKYATHILHIGTTQLFFGTADEYRKSAVGRAFAAIGGDENE